MHNANSQLVTTMFVWFFLSNVLFITYVSNTSMKKNRTRNQPVSNTLLGLWTHCRFFYSILFIKNTRAKDNMANLWRCLLVEYFDYYSIQDCKCERVFILQVLEWNVGSITICQPVSFHKRIVIMVDYSQQFSISMLSFTFLFSGTNLSLPSIICLFITYNSVHYGHACNSWFHYSLSSKVIVSFLHYRIQNNISIW